MIKDTISNLNNYASLNPGISLAIDFLAKPGWENLPEGKHVIQGDAAYVVVSGYESKQFDANSWEAHRKYLDIQIVTQGEEYIYYNHIANMGVVEKYAPANDYIKLSGEGEPYLLSPETFIMLFPQDAHQPGCVTTGQQSIKKFVFKIRVNENE